MFAYGIGSQCWRAQTLKAGFSQECSLFRQPDRAHCYSYNFLVNFSSTIFCLSPNTDTDIKAGNLNIVSLI